MKAKYLCCEWCGGDIVENEPPQYRQNSKKAKKPYAMYCCKNCKNKAMGYK